MGRMIYRCRICGAHTDNRVCNACYERLSQPCPRCGRPTPTIKRDGKPAANPTCTACTASLKAATRRIGRTCRVCGGRSPDTDLFYRVCPDCQAIKVPCPVCGSPMPKYRKKGRLRGSCSQTCNKRLHPITHEQAVAANRTRFAGHVYRSHPNRLARESAEYQAWRQAVFTRDGYTCQDCGACNAAGVGHTVPLHPHHIQPFASHPDLRYAVENGVTLCPACHRKRHKHVFVGRTKRRQPAAQLRLL